MLRSIFNTLTNWRAANFQTVAFMAGLPAASDLLSGNVETAAIKTATGAAILLSSEYGTRAFVNICEKTTAGARSAANTCKNAYKLAAANAASTCGALGAGNLQEKLHNHISSLAPSSSSPGTGNQQWAYAIALLYCFTGSLAVNNMPDTNPMHTFLTSPGLQHFLEMSRMAMCMKSFEGVLQTTSLQASQTIPGSVEPAAFPLTMTADA
ncbi:MAG: hypothetical protein IT558_06010 [Alphaproteobacteria bacterium]|nr:hypothetical protein [Alphaproteobacteria bacterium]